MCGLLGIRLGLPDRRGQCGAPSPISRPASPDGSRPPRRTTRALRDPSTHAGSLGHEAAEPGDGDGSVSRWRSAGVAGGSRGPAGAAPSASQFPHRPADAEARLRCWTVWYLSPAEPKPHADCDRSALRANELPAGVADLLTVAHHQTCSAQVIECLADLDLTASDPLCDVTRSDGAAPDCVNHLIVETLAHCSTGIHRGTRGCPAFAGGVWAGRCTRLSIVGTWSAAPSMLGSARESWVGSSVQRTSASRGWTWCLPASVMPSTSSAALLHVIGQLADCGSGQRSHGSERAWLDSTSAQPARSTRRQHAACLHHALREARMAVTRVATLWTGTSLPPAFEGPHPG